MQEIRLIYRNSNSKDFRQPEEMHMKEQQEKIRVLDPHIILILFISAFVFGIGMLMIFLERKEIRTEGYEFIIFSVEILMLLLILYYMRTVVLSREGCTVSWLFWKRNRFWFPNWSEGAAGRRNQSRIPFLGQPTCERISSWQRYPIFLGYCS